MSKGAKIALGFGLVGTILIVGGLVTAFFAFMNYAEDTLGPPAEAYLARSQAEDYEAAYALAGPRWRREQTFDEYSEFEQSVHDRLGSIVDKDVVGANFQSNPGGTLATLTYSAEFENGDATVTFTLFKQGEEWIVEGVYYESPLLDF